MAAIHDLTERIRSEEALRKRENELKANATELAHTNEELLREIDERKRTENELIIMQSAIESSLNAVGITNLQGKTIYVNDACVNMWGYDHREEMLGRSLSDFWEGEEVFKTIEALSTKGGAEGEDIGKRKDGSLFDAQFAASMIYDKDGEPSYMFGSFFNITERKRSEKALREHEKELKAKATELGEANAALKVLLKKRVEDKNEFEEKFLFNIQELVFPFLDRLKKSQLKSKQKSYLAVVESNLNNLISPFGKAFSASFLKLTPTELQVANFIAQGKTTKELADILDLSRNTIESHRKNIRKKIAITNKKVNLRTRLLAYMDGPGLSTPVSSSSDEIEG